MHDLFYLQAIPVRSYSYIEAWSLENALPQNSFFLSFPLSLCLHDLRSQDFQSHSSLAPAIHSPVSTPIHSLKPAQYWTWTLKQRIIQLLLLPTLTIRSHGSIDRTGRFWLEMKRIQWIVKWIPTHNAYGALTKAFPDFALRHDQDRMVCQRLHGKKCPGRDIKK